MRLKALFAASAVLLTSFSMAQAGTVHTTWEKFKAGHAMHRLSVDGQKAMMDVFQARDLLAQGKTDAAIPPLYDAQKRFKAASADNKKFFAAESQLQPAPQHPVSATHTPVANPTTWVPVGGEFIVSETLAPEKQAALANANKQFQAGQTQQAQQSLQVVGEDADFIMAHKTDTDLGAANCRSYPTRRCPLLCTRACPVSGSHPLANALKSDGLTSAFCSTNGRLCPGSLQTVVHQTPGFSPVPLSR